MPRTTHPASNSGRLAYVAFVRRSRGYFRAEEIRAAKRNALKDQALARHLDQRQRHENHLKRKIDRLEKTPSKLAIALLQEIARSRNTPSMARARAAAILLKWADGDLTYGRRQKRPN